MPPKMEGARDLLVHMLGEMLYVEQAQVDEVLPELAKEAHSQELRKGLEQHLGQTKEQVSRVEKAFELLGEKPQPQPNHAFDGLRKTHDQMAGNIEAESLRDIFNAEAAAKAEHLEIAGYHGLVTMAEQLGESNLAGVLREVEQQEEQMLHRLEEVTQQLGKELTAA
jgi:ferritin-like metal-binding protein YciE